MRAAYTIFLPISLYFLVFPGDAWLINQDVIRYLKASTLPPAHLVIAGFLVAGWLLGNILIGMLVCWVFVVLVFVGVVFSVGMCAGSLVSRFSFHAIVWLLLLHRYCPRQLCIDLKL